MGNVLLWLLVIEILGLVAFPLTFVLFKGLPDRGVTLTKVLALLLTSYLLWILGLTNLTPRPVSLSHKDDLVTVEFHKLDEPCTNPYSGPYQDKLKLTPPDIEMIVEAEAMSLSEVLTTLTSLSTNVGELTVDIRILTENVKMLKWVVPVLIAVVAIGMTVIAVFVGLD